MEPAVQENGEEAGEGRDSREAEPGSPRRCDIITISGRKEKCEAAKEALEVVLALQALLRLGSCPFSSSGSLNPA